MNTSSQNPMSIRNHIYNSGYGYGGTKPSKTVTPWQKRLNPSTGYSAECPNAGSHEAELTMTFTSPSGVDYDLEVVVFAEFEPGQNGGWDDPSWDDHFYGASAFYFRPGHGWKEVTLTKSQEEEICDHFASEMADRGYDGPEPDDYYDSRYDY